MKTINELKMIPAIPSNFMKLWNKLIVLFIKPRRHVTIKPDK